MLSLSFLWQTNRNVRKKTNKTNRFVANTHSSVTHTNSRAVVLTFKPPSNSPSKPRFKNTIISSFIKKMKPLSPTIFWRQRDVIIKIMALHNWKTKNKNGKTQGKIWLWRNQECPSSWKSGFHSFFSTLYFCQKFNVFV